MIPNGRPSTVPTSKDPKHRSASSTIHDRRSDGPSFATSSNGDPSLHHTNSSPSAHQYQQQQTLNPLSSHHLAPSNGGRPPFASPYGSSPSSSSAKESFLNYFFGGSEGMAMASGSAHQGMGASGSGHGGRMSSESGAERGDNPLSGRRGLEGNAAAFDMKSLEKHLEPVSHLNFSSPLRAWFLTLATTSKQTPQRTEMGGNGLTEREEMETYLIRALISSYFSIVRQTIQDLVPKAIMRSFSSSPSLPPDLSSNSSTFHFAPKQTFSSISQGSPSRTDWWRRCTKKPCFKICSMRMKG